MMRKLVCFPFAATKTPPPPRFAWSPSPASRGRMKSAVVLATHARPSFVRFFSPQSRHGCPRKNSEVIASETVQVHWSASTLARGCNLAHLNRLTFVPWTALRMKAGRRSADRRNVSLSARRANKCCHLACARGALVYRRSTAALARGLSPLSLSSRPGLLGRGREHVFARRALPAPSCPSPVEAPHAPAVVPESMMPKAARERGANPPAGAALAPLSKVPSRRRPSMSEICGLYLKW